MFDHLARRPELFERYLLDDEDELDDEEFWTDTDEQRCEAPIEDADPRC